jgi:hypothetical protein
VLSLLTDKKTDGTGRRGEIVFTITPSSAPIVRPDVDTECSGSFSVSILTHSRVNIVVHGGTSGFGRSSDVHTHESEY